MLGRIRHHSVRGVNQVDQALVRQVAGLPHTRTDVGLKRLSTSANHGKLWFAVAAVLAVAKGPTRRAAVRGVGSIAFASVSANLVAKNVFPRRRPAAELLPTYRRLVKRPTSSSFPSGHAASAVAFTTAVAMESPRTAVALAPLAGAVAYSRVHTGVHWPSDIVAGAAIGVGAAYAVRHWWPVAEQGPAHTAHEAKVEPLGDGEGLLVLVNPHSGLGEDPTDELRLRWPKATVVNPVAGADLIEDLSDQVKKSTEEVRALGVAGGDGTVAAVAAVAAEFGLPLVLIPSGTLNHFARDIGVETADDAGDAVREGRGVEIDLAGVKIIERGGGERHRWFVNTASVGGYPEMVRIREKLESKGWPKWPAGAVAMARTLRRAQPIRMALDGRPHLVWWLFVGNGTYDPKGFAPTRRPALDTGLLDVRYLRADVPFSRARFVLATVTRTLHASHVYRELDVPRLRVDLLDGHRRVATDGEVGPLANRFEFESRPRALCVYR
ncbi:bifunctional phosphatase PAP2/diacylglycerol kinase family protein [Actinokineospora xionganensis]|uniref:Phosphatase PAP2 family protein n=1 Tax=Actinokineospora xionganensis TaxID=2684470 RepID=A0ABR7LD95_9PSEU|nr:bifunctional phosphatase PAP2/diacylglycerol kinase family protein [Actinokineospora xionganensis]MBC6450624.1 phosphatase PAP2 family protein [Actinokineospora xionganensis]